MPLSTTITGQLNGFFNLKNFTDVVSKMPKPQTPLTNLLFPIAKRKQKASPFISKSDIQNETGAVPVIRRGSQSYPVDGGGIKSDLFDVQPLTMSKFVSGADLNNMIAMGAVDNVAALLREVVENLRDRTAVSTELLVAQSLSGSIAYPAYVLGGVGETYKVDLGKLKSAGGTALGASATLADLQKLLEAHFVAQQQTGASGDVRFLVGSNAYAKVIDLVTNAKGNVPVQWTDFGCVLFGKYKLMPMTASYVLPGGATPAEVIDSKSMQTIDLQNTGKLFYAALDELDAKLRPLPFFATHISSEDPSGVKILSSSKPLPCFAVNKSVIQKYV